MRRLFYVFIVALMSCSGAKENTFKIEGSLNGLNSRSLIYTKIVNGRPFFLDTIKATGDKFSFDAPILKENDFRFLVPIYNKKSFVKLFLDNSDVMVVGSIDSLHQVRVTGSKSNDLFNPLMTDYNTISLEAQVLVTKIRFEKDLKQKHQFESMLADTDKRKTALFLGFAKDHPESSLSPWALDQIIKFSDYATIYPIAENVSDEAKSSEFYTDLNRKLLLMKPTSKGMPSPKFSLPNIDGKTVTLDEFKGKYVLLNFWSPLCSHCRVENPELVELYNNFGGDDFEIVGINVDFNHDIEIWKLVVKEDKLKYTQLSDTANYSDSYRFSRTPFNVLLDKDGKILGSKLTPESVKDLLNEEVKK